MLLYLINADKTTKFVHSVDKSLLLEDSRFKNLIPRLLVRRFSFLLLLAVGLIHLIFL